MTLCSEHAIERIAMLAGEHAGSVSVHDGYGQFGKAGRLDCTGDIVDQRRHCRQLASFEFDGDLPRRSTADQDAVLPIRHQVPGAQRELGAVEPPPQQRMRIQQIAGHCCHSTNSVSLNGANATAAGIVPW